MAAQEYVRTRQNCVSEIEIPLQLCSDYRKIVDVGSIKIPYTVLDCPLARPRLIIQSW